MIEQGLTQWDVQLNWALAQKEETQSESQTTVVPAPCPGRRAGGQRGQGQDRAHERPREAGTILQANSLGTQSHMSQVASQGQVPSCPQAGHTGELAQVHWLP